MSGRREVDIGLQVLQAQDGNYSTMTLEFPSGASEVIKGFDPGRLYLEDVPGDRYGLVDQEGYRYCGIEKNAEWTAAAEQRGSFVLVMQSGLRGGDAAVRIMVVQYPFGQILRDSEVFQVDLKDLHLAILDGRLIFKVMDGMKTPVPGTRPIN